MSREDSMVEVIGKMEKKSILGGKQHVQRPKSMGLCLENSKSSS